MAIDFLEQVLAPATVSTFMVGALGWLTRSWISDRLKNAIRHEYDEKLATHKAQLKAEADIELEKLRSQLVIASGERQVRFTRLHERRAEVVEKTYGLLSDLQVKLRMYVAVFEPAGWPPKEERRKDVVQAHKEFLTYFMQTRLFLSRPAAEKIDRINDLTTEAFYDFHYQVELDDGTTGARTQKWMEVSKRVNDGIPAVLSELESDFRKLLGDEG